MYLLKKDISQILEIKCDIRATEKFSKRERLEYLLTIVRVLERAESAGRTQPPMLSTGLASRKNQGDTRERFRMITAVPQSISKLCQGAFWTLAVTLVMLSYSFVLQPAFDPPVEDIYTDNTVHEWELSDICLIQHRDSSFSIVFANKETYQINSDIAQMYIEDGIEVRKE